MRTNLILLFNLKKSKGRKTALSAIYARITLNGMRSEIATGMKCDPTKWNSQTGRVNGTKESARVINASLEKLHHRILMIVDKLESQQESITPEMIKNNLQGKSVQDKLIVEIYDHHNAQIRALIGNGFSSGTVQRHETTLKHVKEFIQKQYKRKDISISKINHEFITGLEFFLKSDKNIANNTTVKYIKNFKKIVRNCQANGWITADPFINYKSRLKPVNREFLTEQEMKTIQEKNFEVERLNAVRDVFLFSCFTGLAYIDVQQLKRTEIVTGPDGRPWLQTTRQKTSTASKVPLLPPAIQLIEKYQNCPKCEVNGKVFPVASNQKMNAYLKEIATICHISKPLTYHIARHTFATTVTLANGVCIESVSKMLGHTNIKTTQHYAKILDLKVGRDMAGLHEKFC